MKKTAYIFLITSSFSLFAYKMGDFRACVRDEYVSSTKEKCDRIKEKAFAQYALKFYNDSEEMLRVPIAWQEVAENYRQKKRDDGEELQEALKDLGTIALQIGIALAKSLAIEWTRSYLCNKAAAVLTDDDTYLINTIRVAIRTRTATRIGLEAASVAAVYGYLKGRIDMETGKSAVNASLQLALFDYMIPAACKRINHVIGTCLAGLSTSLPAEKCEYRIENTAVVKMSTQAWNAYYWYRILQR